MTFIFISGPIRSGKSEWGENLLKKNDNVTYIATAENNSEDTRWIERLKKHKERRPPTWIVIEENLNLDKTISKLTDEVIIIDSLGGLVAKHININDEQWESKNELLIYAITNHKSKLVIVSEETGWGLVSNFEVGNLFRDRLGSLNRRLSEISDQSWLVINGYAINIKEIGHNIPI